LDIDEVGRLLLDLYGFTPQVVRRRTSVDAETHVFRVANRQGKQWLLRTRRLNRRLPPRLEAGSSEAWLTRQAQALLWCQRHDFPAPVVQRTLEKMVVSTWEGWAALLIRYLPGETPDEARNQDLAMGELVGRLHALGGFASQAEAWWHPPRDAAQRASGVLAAIDDLPDEWLPLLEACQQALAQAGELEGLPECLVHGDCYPGNVLQLANGRLALIDWEYAGRGLRLLDLATLLEDGYTGSGESLRVDSPRVKAILEGYSRKIRLAEGEISRLGIAIRFGAAYRAAARFWLGEQNGWGELAQQGLLREQNRLRASEMIQAAAQELLEDRFDNRCAVRLAPVVGNPRRLGSLSRE
jgi:Ser/Thr protein kinase RdoA (MazF antagonist)